MSALLSLSPADFPKLTPAKATKKVKLQSNWLLVVLEWPLPCWIRVAEPLGSYASHLPSSTWNKSEGAFSDIYFSACIPSTPLGLHNHQIRNLLGSAGECGNFWCAVSRCFFARN